MANVTAVQTYIRVASYESVHSGRLRRVTFDSSYVQNVDGFLVHYLCVFTVPTVSTVGQAP